MFFIFHQKSTNCQHNRGVRLCIPARVLLSVREFAKKKVHWLTTTTSPIDNKGDGRDLGCNEPIKGRLPLSAKRRAVFTLLDIVVQLL